MERFRPLTKWFICSRIIVWASILARILIPRFTDLKLDTLRIEDGLGARLNILTILTFYLGMGWVCYLHGQKRGRREATERRW